MKLKIQRNFDYIEIDPVLNETDFKIGDKVMMNDDGVESFGFTYYVRTIINKKETKTVFNKVLAISGPFYPEKNFELYPGTTWHPSWIRHFKEYKKL